MAEKEPPAPSRPGADADKTGNTADTPRPIARRPHPVYKPETEALSLQPIGGGAPQSPAAPIGGAPSATAAPAAPLSPPTLGGLNAVGGAAISPAPASNAADAATPAAPAAPASQMSGLSAVGNGSSSTPMPDTPKPLAPPSSVAPSPYPPRARPDIGSGPVGSRVADEPSSNAANAVKIGVGVLAAVGVFFAVSAAMPSKIPVPDKFTTFTSSTGSFSLDVPEGWSRKGEDTKRENGLTGEQSESDADGATFTYGKGIIQVWTDSGGKQMQDQLLAGGGPNFSALLDDKHKELLGILKKRVGNFQQTDAGSFSLAPFGAKVIEYTGKTGFLFFGTKVHGYAATVHGPKHFMMIELQCPESNWDSLKPVYEKILKGAALDGVSAKTLQERLGGGGGFGGALPGAGGIKIPGGGSVSIPPGVGGF